MTRMEEKKMEIKHELIKGEVEERIWSKKIQFVLAITVSIFFIVLIYVAYH